MIYSIKRPTFDHWFEGVTEGYPSLLCHHRYEKGQKMKHGCLPFPISSKRPEPAQETMAFKASSPIRSINIPNRSPFLAFAL